MLVEKKMSEALKDFNKGKKVLVLNTFDDGSMSCEKLEDLFSEDTHFLVDVPAYNNPEFDKEFKHTVHIKQDEKAESEEELPTSKSGGG